MKTWLGFFAFGRMDTSFPKPANDVPSQVILGEVAEGRDWVGLKWGWVVVFEERIASRLSWLQERVWSLSWNSLRRLGISHTSFRHFSFSLIDIRSLWCVVLLLFSLKLLLRKYLHNGTLTSRPDIRPERAPLLLLSPLLFLPSLPPLLSLF